MTLTFRLQIQAVRRHGIGGPARLAITPRFRLQPLRKRRSRSFMSDRVATLSQSFEAQVQKYGARAFLKDKRDKVWTDHSWTDVAEAAGKLRAGLLGLGV